MNWWRAIYLSAFKPMWCVLSRFCISFNVCFDADSWPFCVHEMAFDSFITPIANGFIRIYFSTIIKVQKRLLFTLFLSLSIVYISLFIISIHSAKFKKFFLSNYHHHNSHVYNWHNNTPHGNNNGISSVFFSVETKLSDWNWRCVRLDNFN